VTSARFAHKLKANKPLVPKLDSLWKHVGCCKALVAMLGVKTGDHYFLKTNYHVANEMLHFSKGFEIVLQQITYGAIQVDKKKKNV
jgi:hypothetical protein